MKFGIFQNAESQHFYRLIGYVDCGYLLAPGQEKELFLRKNL